MTTAIGTTTEHRGPLSTVWVEFDAAPEWVLASGPAETGPQGVQLFPVDADKPPVRVRGPITADHVVDGEVDYDLVPETTPDRFDAEGSAVRFHFDEPITEGTYRVFVHASRFRFPAESPTEFVGADGGPWDGWTFIVVSGPQIETAPAPLDVGDQTLNPPRPGTDRVVVRLDGQAVPAGTSELSGEVLTVEGPAHVLEGLGVEVDGLLSPARTLYALHLCRTDRAVDRDGSTTPAAHFTAAAPARKTAFAVYHRRQTEGLVPLGSDALPAQGVPVLRPPRTTDPLVTTRDETVTVRSNTYRVVSYVVVPRPAAARALVPETAPPGVAYPVEIVDEFDTPEHDPVVLDEIAEASSATAVLYDADPLESPGEEAPAVLDLPLGCRVRLYHTDPAGHRQELWWGQTRLVPLVVPAAQYARESGATPATPADVAEARARIWRASIEALRLWGCKIPGRPVRTMTEYVLTRAAYGWPREDEFSGRFSAQMGQHSVQGQSDNRLEMRLRGLAALLRGCQAAPPLFPEDEEEYHAATARVASTARPEYHPGGPDPLAYVPVYDGSTSAERRYFYSSGDNAAVARPLYP